METTYIVAAYMANPPIWRVIFWYIPFFTWLKYNRLYGGKIGGANACHISGFHCTLLLVHVRKKQNDVSRKLTYYICSTYQDMNSEKE